MAIFTNNDKSRKKTVHFGANGMSDYTIHKDKDRMKRYLNRHKKEKIGNNVIQQAHYQGGYYGINHHYKLL